MDSVQNYVEAISKRYSVRGFDPERHVPQEVIDACIEAVKTAPSAVGRYPYRVHVVPGKVINELGVQTNDKVAALFPSVQAARLRAGASNCVFYDCDVAFLFTRRPGLTHDEQLDEWTGYDVGLASQVVIDVAALAGLGSICIGVIHSVIAKETKEFLELADDEEPLLAVCIGYPKDKFHHGRHPIEFVMH